MRKHASKRPVFYLLLFVFLYLIISAGRNLFTTLRASGRLETAEKENTGLKGKNRELKALLNKVQTREFIEGEIRDKLNMAKQGEKIVIMSELPADEKKEEKDLANWERWRRLFF